MLFKENVIFFSLYNKDDIYYVFFNYEVLAFLRCDEFKYITRNFCDEFCFNSRNFLKLKF